MNAFRGFGVFSFALFVAAGLRAADTSHWEKFFPNGLIDAQGVKVAARSLDGKIVCLYFSASWCGPCKFVTPRVAALREHSKGALEVVLVSQDRSEAEQFKYMREANMKWPAVNWADYRDKDGNEVRTLVSKYQAWGIPAVVILSRTGEVIDGEARMKVQHLPEEYARILEAFHYDEAAKRYRAEREKNGETVTKAQEDRYVQLTRSRLEGIIREFKELHEQSLKTHPPAPQPSWDDLLANFYRWQRKQAADH
jgi:thiol-disulfide isomerase/thioredoxin